MLHLALEGDGVLKTRLVTFVVAILIAMGFGFMTASEASAGQQYLVNEPAVCRYQGHLSATLWNPTPYGWFCVS